MEVTVSYLLMGQKVYQFKAKDYINKRLYTVFR